MKQLAQATSLVLFVCVAVRIGAWLVDPLVPPLVVLTALVAILLLLLAQVRW
jgi:CHASE2 domain-containing sensor protein